MAVFSGNNSNVFDIDPCHCYSAPGLTYNCGYKFCQEVWNTAYNIIRKSTPLTLELMREQTYWEPIQKRIKDSFEKLTKLQSGKAYEINNLEPLDLTFSNSPIGLKH